VKVVGIDPGKKGAIVALYDSKPHITPMPIIRARPGEGRDEYDIAAIVALFRDQLEMGDPIDLVMVEKAQPLPPIRTSDGVELGGSLANFNRGVQSGFVWLLAALEIPCQPVPARTWQKIMLAGTPGADTKQRSILAAGRLFPGVDLKRSARSRKSDDGIADALLLAEYARRIKNGGSRNG